MFVHAFYTWSSAPDLIMTELDFLTHKPFKLHIWKGRRVIARVDPSFIKDRYRSLTIGMKTIKRGSIEQKKLKYAH